MRKADLLQYGYLQEEIKDLTERRQNLLASVVGAVNIDGMPKGTDIGDRTGRIAGKLIELGELLEQKIFYLTTLRMTIEREIGSLEDSRHRIVLTKKYIDGKTWEQIAVEMNYGSSHCRRLADAALQKLGNKEQV